PKLRDLQVRLSPRRRERIAELGPVPRAAQRAVADRHPQPLECVVRLDQVLVGGDGQLVRRGDRGGRLLCALQRRCGHVGDVVVGQRVRDRARLRLAVQRKPEVRQPAVEDARGIVDLAVAQEVHHRADITFLGHCSPSCACAAATAAACAAVSMVANASSSSAADTNQVSNALAGAYTPWSSSAWKNAGYRHVWEFLAPVKSTTGSGEKNNPVIVPAFCTRWGTPAAVRASLRMVRSVRALRSRAWWTAPSAARSVARPAAVATGFPDSVPAW